MSHPSLPFALRYAAVVPVLSTFFGIVVRMYFEDHPPPHFHVEYGGARAVVELETGRILAGRLPARCAGLVEDWRQLHLADLRWAWEAASRSRLPRRIKPLS